MSVSLRRITARFVAGGVVVASVAAVGFGAPPAAADVPSTATKPDRMSAALVSLAFADRVGSNASQATASPNRGAGAPEPGTPARDERGRLLVDVTLRDGDAALAAVARLGAEIVATDDSSTLATVAVAVEALTTLADLPGVAYVTEVPVPYRNGIAGGVVPRVATCGTGVVSEGDTQLGAAGLRTSAGVDGSGVTVGVVSDSYDTLGGAAGSVAAGELPGSGNPCGRTSPVVVQHEYLGGGTVDEGRAMAEIVHDLAPGASLRLASGWSGELSMAQQIEQLADAGATVITDDLAYDVEPMFQDGPIAAAIARNRALGVVHLSAAGNSNVVIGGKNVSSYEAPAFRPSACPSAIPGYQNACHDFDTGAGSDAGAGITIAAGGGIRLVLGWSEPMYGVGTDLDVYLVDTVTGVVVASSELVNANSMRASEYLGYTNTTGLTRTFDVVVARYGSAPSPNGTPRFKYVLMRSGGITAVEYDTSVGGDTVGPTSIGHNVSSAAVSVAAVPFDDATSAEPFSSRGPQAICWAPASGSTPQPAMSPCSTVTIDLAATDGAATSFFGSNDAGTWRFYGTSAAAPHVAAVVALLREAHPCATPDTIEAELAGGAASVGGAAADTVGAGLVDASAAHALLEAGDGNCPPTIGPLDTVRLRGGVTSAPIALTLSDDGPTTSLTVSVTSDDAALLPSTSFAVSGTGGNRTLRITPPVNAHGTTTVKVKVTDQLGASVTGTFQVDVDATDLAPLVPARLADTRVGSDFTTVDGTGLGAGRLGPTRTLVVGAAGRGGVPSDAVAVMLNVTAVRPSSRGFLTVYPCGSPVPTASNLNFVADDVVANAVLAKVGSGGAVCVYTSAETDIVVDVAGYVPSGTSGLTPLSPARVLETRTDPTATTIDGRSRGGGPIGAGNVLTLPVAGRGGVPNDAVAVVLNVTAVRPTARGYLTVYPCGDSAPTASNLNFLTDDVVANAVLAKVGSNGSVCIFSLAATDLVADVAGYIPAGSPGFGSLVPARLLETRTTSGATTVDSRHQGVGRVAAGGTVEVSVTGRGGVPSDAQAVWLNVTAVSASARGYLTVYPCGTARPTASNLNYGPGEVVPNAVLAKVGTGGAVCVYTLSESDVVIDVMGYVP